MEVLNYGLDFFIVSKAAQFISQMSFGCLCLLNNFPFHFHSFSILYACTIVHIHRLVFVAHSIASLGDCSGYY